MPSIGKNEIVAGLAGLGLPGQTQAPKVLVHSSLSASVTSREAPIP